MCLSFLSRRPAQLFLAFAGRSCATSRTLSFAPTTTELLEQRLAMTATMPTIQMLSATTTDSKSITIDYEVNQVPDATNPIQIGIYRSSNGQFDSNDSLVGTVTLAAPGRLLGQVVSLSIRTVSQPSPLVSMN